STAEAFAVGSAGAASTKPSRGEGSSVRPGARHRMDRLETWEIPFTSACERTGSSGSRWNNDPGLEGPSDLPGAQTARHEARRSAWTSEAKQISDRGCVAGSRSTPIGPDSPGPDRGKRGAMWREPLAGNTGEDLEPHKPVHETTTDSCTGGNATKWDSHLRGFFCRMSHGQ